MCEIEIIPTQSIARSEKPRCHAFLQHMETVADGGLRSIIKGEIRVEQKQLAQPYGVICFTPEHVSPHSEGFARLPDDRHIRC
jgi:hypothetical protein